jgi:hypothetical protein
MMAICATSQILGGGKQRPLTQSDNYLEENSAEFGCKL